MSFHLKRYISKISQLIFLSIQGKSNLGFCTVCNKKTVFAKTGVYDRDDYKCLRCGSLPRQRIFIFALNLFSPNWKNLQIHESSPGGPSSDFVAQQCKNYSYSQFYLDKKPGEDLGDHQCQNLEALTYPDNSFDVFITQDVFEHIFNPGKAFKEIERVLKRGGIHIFTTPYRNWKPSLQRAQMLDNGQIHNLEPEEYHGNPIGDGKSLVTFDWGNDFVFMISNWCKMSTLIYEKDDKKFGLSGELKEVFVSKKAE